jgi:hypothetical protein
MADRQTQTPDSTSWCAAVDTHCRNLFAIIFLLVLSASKSTLSSLVLLSASAIAYRSYKGLENQKYKEKSLMMMLFRDRRPSSSFRTPSRATIRDHRDALVYVVGGVAELSWRRSCTDRWSARDACRGQAGMITGIVSAIG